MSGGHRPEATAPPEPAVERWHGFAVTEGEKEYCYKKTQLFSPSVSLRSPAPSSEGAKLDPNFCQRTYLKKGILVFATENTLKTFVIPN